MNTPLAEAELAVAKMLIPARGNVISSNASLLRLLRQVLKEIISPQIVLNYTITSRQMESVWVQNVQPQLPVPTWESSTEITFITTLIINHNP